MTGANADYGKWIGVSETLEDTMDPEQARAAAAIFDEPVDVFRAGAALPPLWHWFYFRSCTPQRSLGADGHATRGDFLPPVSLPRRMIAGGRLTFHRPLVLGAPAVRERALADVRQTRGRSGSLVFVTVRSRLTQHGSCCCDEELDIVYRERSAAVALPAPAAWPPIPVGARVRDVLPDSRLLFRFSALTFNAHRIHYDRDYTREEEGYPGLVVHGPLLAMWLMAHATAAGGRASHEVRHFSYRSERPAFDGAMLRLVSAGSGATRQLHALRADGLIAQAATATLG